MEAKRWLRCSLEDAHWFVRGGILRARPHQRLASERIRRQPFLSPDCLAASRSFCARHWPNDREVLLPAAVLRQIWKGPGWRNSLSRTVPAAFWCGRSRHRTGRADGCFFRMVRAMAVALGWQGRLLWHSNGKGDRYGTVCAHAKPLRFSRPGVLRRPSRFCAPKSSKTVP